MSKLTVTVARLGKTFEVESTTLPPATIEYLLQNGFSQALNDCIAGKTDEDKTAETAGAATRAIESKFARMLSGDLKAGSGGGFTKLDERSRVEREILRNLLGKNGEKAEAADRLSRDPEAAYQRLAEVSAKRQDRGDILTVKDEVKAKISGVVDTTLAARAEPII